MLSYEYRQFLNEKIRLYLPSQRWVNGNKINFKCPICGDGKTGHKHRAWWFDDTASFYCWNSCGGMSGIKFLQYISGENYEDIKKEYIQLFLKHKGNFNLSSEYEVPDKEPSFFDIKSIVKPEWKQPLTLDATQYLSNRLVLQAPFLHDSLYSWINAKGNEYILIPWKINNVDGYFQLNDFKKNGSIKYIFPKDQKKLVYGLDNIDVSFPYIIAFEGVYDSLFVKNGIALGTKAITDYQMKLITSRWPKHELVIAFDNDKAGINAMKKIINENDNVKFFRWFNEDTQEKDINDYIKAKQNVNIFKNESDITPLICDKLMMKMQLIKSGLWN